jgi:predicted unusual protein kinase regulating ubiquinone biosynthesis (AarF/ABC1/UbiB family)
MQDVTAIKLNDVDGLRAAGIDPAEVAIDFASVMFDQLFKDGFFHADPHPGNIFVTLHAPTDPELGEGSIGGDPAGRAWHFTFIDFGMMGEVPPGLRKGLRRVLIAAASRDGKGMVDGIREVGVLLPSADTAELERAMTKLFARFGGMGFAELQEVDPREFRAFAIEFGDVVRSLPFQFPENFLLIIRAMSLVSGNCSSLNPRSTSGTPSSPTPAS